MTYCINIKEKIASVKINWMSDKKNMKIKRCKNCNILFTTRINFLTLKAKHSLCLLCRMEKWYLKKEFIINSFISYKVNNFKELKKLFINKHLDLERRRLNELKVKWVILKNIPICNRI